MKTLTVVIVTAVCFLLSGVRCQLECVSGRFKGDDMDCNVFYKCSYSKWVRFICPPGLAWSNKTLVCQWPVDVPGCRPTDDQCNPNRCQSGGRCFPLTHPSIGYRCECTNGLTGNCAPDPCIGSPCRNRGICVPSGSSFSCRCSGLFAGDRCQTECPRFPCPSDVGQALFPDFKDRTCKSYYKCQRGQLGLETCQGNLVFDIFTSKCIVPGGPDYKPCTVSFTS